MYSTNPVSPARRQADDDLLRQHHAEYLAWLAEIETCEVPDDLGPADGANLTAPAGLFTPAELFWLGEYAAEHGDRLARLADLRPF